MMTDYQIQPNTRKCAVTGRELQAGEKYYAVLVEEGDHWLRRDYSVEGWQGPPADAIGFWAGRVPPPDAHAKPKFDDDMLLDCFARLEPETEQRKVSFRYVIALLLMRRKRFKFERTIASAGQQTLCLRCVKTGAEHHVIDPGLSEEELEKVQDDVFHVLGWS
jgi:hypothetical protein